MKIALLSPFYPYRGGIAQFSDRLLSELEKNSEVKAFSYTTLYPSFLFPGKSQIVPDPRLEEQKSTELLSSVNPFSAIKTARAINKFAPDVLIVAYWMFFFVPILTFLFRFLKEDIKVVGLVHNAFAHESSLFDKPMAKLFFKQCDAIVCMSEAVKYDILKVYPKMNILVNEHPIYDHYGSKLDNKIARQELGLDPNKKTLLFFGLIRDYKGLDLLIESLNELDDSYQLLIAGECYGSFQIYQDLISKCPYSANIHVFEEYISDDRVGLFFSATDVLVLPYKSATQSGVLSISYHFETPVIATNVGGLQKPIIENKIGMVIDELSAQGIGKTIKDFFASDVSNFVEHSRKVRQRLSWANYSVKLVDFLGRL